MGPKIKWPTDINILRARNRIAFDMMLKKRKPSPNISKQALKSFTAIYKFFTEVLPGFKGTILSGVIMNKYLKYDMTEEVYSCIWNGKDNRRHLRNLENKLRENRSFENTLFAQLKKWGEAELSPPEIEEHKFEGKVIYTEDIRRRKVSQQRGMLEHVYKDVFCLAAFKYTLEELVNLAMNGDDSSLFKLVYLDKLFLTARFTQKRIRLAQSMEDYEFFHKLAKQLESDGYRDHFDSSKHGMAVVLLWFLGCDQLTYREFQSVVQENVGYKWTYPESFLTFVHRLGLYKYPKKRHKKKKTSS